MLTENFQKKKKKPKPDKKKKKKNKKSHGEIGASNFS